MRRLCQAAVRWSRAGAGLSGPLYACVATADSRLISLCDGKIRFTWKDYRRDGAKLMTLDASEFIRRFLLHALPNGFHRIRYYRFLANGQRGDNLALCRRLLDADHAKAKSELADGHAKGDRRNYASNFIIRPERGGTMRRIAAVSALIYLSAILL